MSEVDRTGKIRFLVSHDYGMGGLWWWIRARSAEEIVLTLAETEVITDPGQLSAAASWSLAEVDIDEVDGDPALAELRAERDGQRDQPGFGALVGRPLVYLSDQDDPEDDSVYLVELGPDGRRLRQVEVRPDGGHERSTERDWPFNPPFDLHDPRFAAMEIDVEVFERAWRGAAEAPLAQGGQTVDTG
ncbi:hypothetical protein [Crossiella cryophila]|uniref:Uncharacterized protein n=1 Tax=Crossiella cryophila TaxID=43355 RepID=A0A7W7FUS5_9PSEU|nr:hypothetical protein [Crossiella cryophila]MBB4677753.1 hypothetical protein [Crossiella cryophila]